MFETDSIESLPRLGLGLDNVPPLTRDSFQFIDVSDTVPRFSDDTAAHFQSFDEERPARDLESSL